MPSLLLLAVWQQNRHCLCAFEEFGTGLERACNAELIRVRHVSHASNWEDF